MELGSLERIALHGTRLRGKFRIGEKMTPQTQDENQSQERELRWRLMGHFLEMDLPQLRTLEVLAIDLKKEEQS